MRADVGPHLAPPDRSAPPASTAPPLPDAAVEAIVAGLNGFGVRYVLIGGIAAEFHGVEGERSRDFDIVALRAESDPENLERLAEYLQVAGARPRHWPDDVTPPPHRAAELAHVGHARYMIGRWPLDVSFGISAFEHDAYRRLMANAVTMTIGDQSVPVAALDDLIASKRAAGRPKDLIRLPAMVRRLRDPRRGRG